MIKPRPMKNMTPAQMKDYTRNVLMKLPKPTAKQIEDAKRAANSPVSMPIADWEGQTLTVKKKVQKYLSKQG